jgi:hypothetical protein
VGTWWAHGFGVCSLSVLGAPRYLRAVYQGKIIAEHMRMKAAIEALPFERPKLSVSVAANFRGMGEAIDAAHQRHVAPQSAKVLTHERERER